MGSNDQEYTILYILYILLSHPFKSLTNCSCALCTRFKSNKTTTGIYLLQQHPKIASCWQCFGQDSWILQREETNYNPKGQGLRTTKNIVWPWHPKSFHLWSSICSLSGESPLTLHYPEPSAPIHPTLNVRTRPKEAWENFASACKLCLGKQPRVWWCLVPAPKALVIDDWRPKPIKLDQVAIVGKYGVMERRLVLICQPIVSTGMMQHVPKDLPCPHPSRPPGTGEA